MPFNVSTFRATLTNDGARAALFDVLLTPPPVLQLSGIVPDITFKAKGTSLPGDSVSSINVNYFGREIKVAGTRTFPDWSITVINDENFLIRNQMEIWMSALNNHVANLRDISMRTMATYQTQAFVTQYAKTGQIVKIYKFVGIFPTDVSAIDLDWASGDQIEEFAVTFAYQWWESLGLSTETGVTTTDFA
jgi:hypothetical protein